MSLCDDKEQKKMALKTLQKYSLITVFTLDDLQYIRLHRLTSEAMKRRLEKHLSVYKEAKKTMMRKLKALTEEAVREENSDRRDEKVANLQNHLSLMHQLISTDDLEEINFIDCLILVKSETNDRDQVKLQEDKIEKLKVFYKQEETRDI